MASDKKIKTDPAPKGEAAAKDKSTSDVASTKADVASTKADVASTKPDVASTKAESSEAPAAAAPSNYSRGEGQKPVSQAYRDNWDAIYAKKAKPKKKR